MRRSEVRVARLEAELAQARQGVRGGGRATIETILPEGPVETAGFDKVTRPTASVEKGEIINVNFAGDGKKGRAAVGQGENDYWNRYHFPFAMHATLEDLKTSSSRPTGALLQTHTLPGEWGWTCQDPMWGTYSYSEGEAGYLRFPNLPAGTYQLFVFAHPAGDPNPEEAWDAFTRTHVEADGKDYGVLNTEASHDFLSLDWKKGVHYVEFEELEIHDGGMLNITLLRGGRNAKPAINGLQLIRVR